MEYQRLPVFPEIVTMLHKFGKLFKLTPISFPELEQALDYEAENYGVDRDCWVRSKVLLKLYRELLSFFGCSAECDRFRINSRHSCKNLFVVSERKSIPRYGRYYQNGVEEVC